MVTMIIINRRHYYYSLTLSLALAHDGADALEPLHKYHQWSLLLSLLSSIAVRILSR